MKNSDNNPRDYVFCHHQGNEKLLLADPFSRNINVFVELWISWVSLSNGMTIKGYDSRTIIFVSS